MEAKAKHLVAGAALGVAGMLLLGLLIAIAVAYTGVYNVAASKEHAAGMRWLLETTMQSSVRSHAGEGQVPDGRVDLAAGAREFKAMCEHCHGGAGVEPAGWSRGMRPRPPHLTEAASEWRPAELLWIIRHGIKDTGMPSFGETHDDATLRNIAAFVQRLPAMTPEEYRMSAPAADSRAGGHPGPDGQGAGRGDHH